MNDLGRRYFLFVGTPRGKQVVIGVLIALACVLDIVAGGLARTNAPSHTIRMLYALAGGMLMAGIIFLFTTRRSA